MNEISEQEASFFEKLKKITIVAMWTVGVLGLGIAIGLAMQVVN